MKKISQVYETIRELICLVFYASDNLTSSYAFLGEYEFNEKKYKLYLLGPSIFIKCGNDSLFIKIEDYSYSEYINGPIYNDVILHINNYKNIDIDDIPFLNLEYISKNNIINESKIILHNYLYSSDLYHNDNPFQQNGLNEKRYTFCESETFDAFLKEKNFLPKMEGKFSPEIILTLIEQVYPNFEQIYLDNKINGIIDSLSLEELSLLKQKMQEIEQGQLVKKLEPQK